MKSQKTKPIESYFTVHAGKGDLYIIYNTIEV